MARKTRKLPTKKLKHLYESVGLYDALYNRHLGYKMGEAGAFANILQEEEVRPSSILELFASNGSRHKDFFALQYTYWPEVSLYKSLDGFAPPSEGVIVADAGHDEYGEKFDSVLAYFYSVSSAVDPSSETGNITEEYMTALFSNVLKHLNPGGTFVIDSPTDGYRVALASVCSNVNSDGELEFIVRKGHSLRAELKAEGVVFEDNDDVVLKYTSESLYNRLTSNCEDWYKSLKVYVNDVAKFAYKVKQPFCQRYFSEPETVRMLQKAGFSDIDFWACEYVEGDSWKLEHTLHGDDYDDDDEMAIMPNIFVARAPK